MLQLVSNRYAHHPAIPADNQIRDLGLEKDIIAIPKSHPSAKNRYILDESTRRLRKLSLNPVSSAISPGTMLSAALEPYRARRGKETTDESVDSYLRRRFGSGVAHLASAGLHGIYAASSGDLSAKAVLGRVYDWEKEYGSVIAGMLFSGRSRQAAVENKAEASRWQSLGQLGIDREDWAMYGLKGGLQTLTDRLTEAVKQQGVETVEADVESVSVTSDGVVVGLPFSFHPLACLTAGKQQSARASRLAYLIDAISLRAGIVVGSFRNNTTDAKDLSRCRDFCLPPCVRRNTP